MARLQNMLVSFCVFVASLNTPHAFTEPATNNRKPDPGSNSIMCDLAAAEDFLVVSQHIQINFFSRCIQI